VHSFLEVYIISYNLWIEVVMRLKSGQYWFMGIVLTLALAMLACEQKSINEIRADPGRYANKEVAVVGNVTRSFSLLGRGAYEVDDGTGKLWVISEKGVPMQGARVLVKGTIRDGYNLGELVKLPELLSPGLVMIEKEHRAK
jgi:hypothetical protein